MVSSVLSDGDRLPGRFRFRRRHLLGILALALLYAVLGLWCLPQERPLGIVTPTCFLPEGLALAAGLGLAIVAQTITGLGEGPFVVHGVVHILDLKGFVLGLGVTAQVLAVLLGERARLEEQLRHYAFFDPLTDLPSRRMFQESLKTIQHDCERDRGWAALILLDLDRFKQLNDSHGHPVGDRLLIEVARRLQGCLRQNDLVARLGGDEFAAILPDLGLRAIRPWSRLRPRWIGWRPAWPSLSIWKGSAIRLPQASACRSFRGPGLRSMS